MAPLGDSVSPSPTEDRPSAHEPSPRTPEPWTREIPGAQPPHFQASLPVHPSRKGWLQLPRLLARAEATLLVVFLKLSLAEDLGLALRCQHLPHLHCLPGIFLSRVHHPATEQ